MPIMHGSYAEDGSIQGILSSLPFPYTCTNVSSAALTINKILTKKILHDSCIPVLPTYRIDKQDIKDSHSKNKILKEISERFPFPLFVKPSSGGSSQGISKVKSHQKLIPAIELALELDSMVLVEPALIDRQEIEVAVTGNEDITTYTPAEIITSYEFYDYTAKYINPASTNFFLPAHINKNMIKQIQLYARQAYKAVGCSIMARVDFLIDTQKQQIYVNEINTIPGFTTISMFPRMLMHDGISYPQIIELLIQLAIARQCTNSINTTSRIQ
ncbi:hypothetical protein LSH36_583g02456 [Paralvinella palmiformis]|uniref:ATP-grasp domain-containing protein n=1 Tax=Paralvinella palmiformis TaxID=53620 RepID=A0AAD9J642_9ANNE|nr:hypothetical protein LSH36_583g02456 [Paralvinella palmiformis]